MVSNASEWESQQEKRGDEPGLAHSEEVVGTGKGKAP
jgi:hypothetical protein